eukprot:4916331-Ditylum_brightwellii.AAC.1
MDPQIKGYDPVELYQLEMCVQFLSCGATTKHPTSDVQDKLKSLVIKLHETFPDMQRLFEYTVLEKGYKNVSLTLHAIANVVLQL